MSSWTETHFLVIGDKKITKNGNFIEPQAPEMLNLQMLKGNRNGLKETFSVFISASTSKALFDDENPMGKVIRMDNKIDAKVTGVYTDLPGNSSFSDMSFVAPWNFKLVKNKWMTTMDNPWAITHSRFLYRLPITSICSPSRIK